MTRSEIYGRIQWHLGELRRETGLASIQIVATDCTTENTAVLQAGIGDTFARYGACKAYALDFEKNPLGEAEEI